MSYQPVAAEDPREMQMRQISDHSALQISEHTHKHKHKRKDKLTVKKKDKKEKHRKHKRKKDKKKKKSAKEVDTISRSGLDMMLSTSPKYLEEISSKKKLSPKSAKGGISPKQEASKA